MTHFPLEIWNYVANWLLPFDKRSLALTRKNPLEKLSKSQLEIVQIWNEIFPHGRWPDKALKRYLKVALIGPVRDIKRPLQNETKPYLFLVTTPGIYYPEIDINLNPKLKKFEEELYETMGGKKLLLNDERGPEREFKHFILNLGGVFHQYQGPRFPKDLYESWSSLSSQEILYYHAPAIQSTEVSKCNSHHGYGVDFIISLEDGEDIRFRCYNR